MFYFSVGQPPRCIADNPLASTRPQKFTTSACIHTPPNAFRIENKDFNNSFSRERKKVQVIIIKLSNNSCVNIKQEVLEETFTELLKSNNLITSFRSGNLQISKMENYIFQK